MISHPRNLEPICELLLEHPAQRVLEVGTGMGKIGLLVREAEVVRKAEAGDWTPGIETYLAGSDIAAYFHPARFPWLDFIYDEFRPDFDATRCDDGYLERFDMVILVDVVEHWSIEAGVEFVGRCLRAGCSVLVSTPIEPVMYEEDFYGAPRHQSRWTDDEFMRLALTIDGPIACWEHDTDMAFVRLFKPVER